MRSQKRTGAWVLAGLGAIAIFAAASAWLTAPRVGGQMDPRATSPLGAHALVALLQERGVDVVITDTVDDVQRQARPDSLLLIADGGYLRDDALITRLADTPGDRLLVEPGPAARRLLATDIRLTESGDAGSEPDCALPEATRAGTVQLDFAVTYEQAGSAPLTRCYRGALVRYQADGRSTTVVGTPDFMTNGGLREQGNAALAMNLAGSRSRLIWFAPQHIQGDIAGDKSINELIPQAAVWVAVQLILVVVLLALWQGRRLGPLVAEQMPVVVRASETAEGRARLYRANRARDQAAKALRAATLGRIGPRLGVPGNADQGAVVAAVTRGGSLPAHVAHQTLFGATPQSDPELVELAIQLDNIERQVDRP